MLYSGNDICNFENPAHFYSIFRTIKSKACRKIENDIIIVLNFSVFRRHQSTFFIYRHTQYATYVCSSYRIFMDKTNSINIISEMEFHYEMVLLRMKNDSLDQPSLQLLCVCICCTYELQITFFMLGAVAIVHKIFSHHPYSVPVQRGIFWTKMMQYIY